MGHLWLLAKTNVDELRLCRGSPGACVLASKIECSLDFGYVEESWNICVCFKKNNVIGLQLCKGILVQSSCIKQQCFWTSVIQRNPGTFAFAFKNEALLRRLGGPWESLGASGVSGGFLVISRGSLEAPWGSSGAALGLLLIGVGIKHKSNINQI